jgi:predicted ATPase
MESIRIKNFRSLQDTGNIELKPITVLVGKNSAGKSTFLRTFPLFKQSVEERTKAPILLYTRNGVDFGSYKDVKSVFAKDEEYLEFEFSLSNMIFNKRRHRYLSWSSDDTVPDFKISMKIDSDSDDTPILKILELQVFKNVIEIHFDVKENIIVRLLINQQEVIFERDLLFFGRGFIPDRFLFRDKKNRNDLEDYAKEKLITLISEKVRSGTSQELIEFIFEKSSLLQSIEDTLNQLKSINQSKTWFKKMNTMKISSSWFQEFYQLVIVLHIEEILSTSNNHLRETFHRVKYIAPIRATAERYYRIQDLSVDEVDPHGQNLPMFLGSLSKTMMKKFNVWTEENFDFKVKIKRIEGHYSMKILYANDFEVNISDMGFGYSQILPIITQLWYSSEQREPRYYGMGDIPTIFVIEQPELHLHPEFQAKFADVIVKVINGIEKGRSNIKLIIETHSQTLINRLGLNIAKEKFLKENINIIIFNKENEGEATTIQSANFDDDGLLENWPIGFFKPSSL